MATVAQLRELKEEEALKAMISKKKGRDDEFDKALGQSDELSTLKFHSEDLEKLLKELDSDQAAGLSPQKAEEKLKVFGQNKLAEKATLPWWVRLLLEMVGIFSDMLWIGAVLAFIGYGLDTTDPSNLYLGIVIIVVIIVTGSFAYYQNSKSEAVMAKFKDFIPPKANVTRGGAKMTIDAVNLVPGDIVKISLGEKIPADVRLFASSSMKVDNSSLTGESEPLLRDPVNTKEKMLEAENMAFFGTTCVEGSGEGVVVQTGGNTIIGRIAFLASSAEQGDTTLAADLRKFMIMIAIIALSFGFTFFGLGFIYGTPIVQNTIYAIGIIVANVPEGLLITLTVSLSTTAARLAGSNVLVKNLQAVETLGSTSCICSDKTGTLTQNRMAPSRSFCFGKEFDISLSKDEYEFQLTTNPNVPPRKYDDPLFLRFAHHLILCSEVEIEEPSEEDIRKRLAKEQKLSDDKMVTRELYEKHKERIEQLIIKTTLYKNRRTRLGNPTEAGMLKYIASILNYKKVRADHPLAFNIPFSSALKYCLMIRKETDPETKAFSHFLLLLKGAAESVLLKCSKIDLGDHVEDMNEELRGMCDQKNSEYASRGERVLALAYISLDPGKYPESTKFFSEGPNLNVPTRDLTFMGFISLYDPPREGVEKSIDECHEAGIQVIMVTGDQPETAKAIAHQIHIISNLNMEYGNMVKRGIPKEVAEKECKAIVIHGNELALRHKEDAKKLADDPEKDLYLQQWLKKKEVVFARLNPAQKLIIVDACQKLGHIVAVTGDGVNDSPAMEKANIGIAMGSGSDVAKDAADMVLLTDDFSSIVIGVEQGRLIFDNLKKSIVYTLASNIPELVPYLMYIVFQIPLPLTTILMLFVDVGTDLWPAISFAYEPAELNIMKRKPRVPDRDSLVSRKCIIFAYLEMGMMESFAGMYAYYSVMADYGFRPMNLHFFGFEKGCVPGSKDPSYRPFDWTGSKDESQDIREFYSGCPDSKGSRVADPSFYYPTEDALDNISNITGNPIRYTSEALKHAQTSFLIAIIVSQWADLIVVKTRSLSLAQHGFDNVPSIFGLAFETILGVLVTYVPFLNIGLGTRQLDLRHLGVNVFPFFFFTIIYDETRKFLMNYLSRVERGKKPIYSWLYRNTMY